jgi:hypothetical protein
MISDTYFLCTLNTIRPRLPRCRGRRTVEVLCRARRSVVVVPRSCSRCWLCSFPLLALLLPVPIPRAVSVGRRRPVLPPANSGEQRRWGCGVSSSLPFIVPLSTLRAAARRGGVGVGGAGSCFVSWEDSLAYKIS